VTGVSLQGRVTTLKHATLITVAVVNGEYLGLEVTLECTERLCFVFTC